MFPLTFSTAPARSGRRRLLLADAERQPLPLRWLRQLQQYANRDSIKTYVLVYDYPSGACRRPSCTVLLYSQLVQVEQQLDLQEYNGSFYTNTYGNQAKWLYSPILNQYGEHWYTLIPSGGNSVLHAWEGYQDSSIGAVVATFSGASVYDSPTLLTTATYLPDPPAGTATVDTNGNLTINLPSSGFVGTFQVVVTASDSTSIKFPNRCTVISTDTEPTLSVEQNGATVTAGSTLSVSTTTSASALSDPVTATARKRSDGDHDGVEVSSYSPLV